MSAGPKAARLLRPGGWLALLTTGGTLPRAASHGAAGTVDEIQPPGHGLERPAGLKKLLESSSRVDLTQETFLAMAQVCSTG